MQRRVAGVALCSVLLAVASACGGGDEGGPASETTAVDVPAAAASCAFFVRYEGELYTAWGVEIVPPEGRPLGVGVLPGCDDGHGASGDEEIQLVELPGVSPDVAVLAPGFPDMVLVREGLDAPPEVESLMRAPRCDPADEPIDLAGPWLGILGADGSTEVDLKPPYDVDLFAETSSAARYERAYLTVRVPASLDEPLTRADVTSSLWEGGTVSVTARCGDGGAYVAERIASQPPG